MSAINQVVLQEDYNEKYEPSPEELQEYCGVIGLNPKEDPDLLWIAREGLKAPLPPDWKPVKDNSSGDVYYFNFSSGESTWDHPCDEYYQKLLQQEKAKKGKRSGGVARKQDRLVAPAAQPAKVGMSLAPLKLPGSGSSGLSGVKPVLGPLKGIPPLKRSAESIQTRPMTGSGLNPLDTRAMMSRPVVVSNVVDAADMLRTSEESDDDVSIGMGDKLAQHDIAGLGFMESKNGSSADSALDRPEIHPMRRSESFPVEGGSESEPDFGLASRLVGLSPELLTPVLAQPAVPTAIQPQKPIHNDKEAVLTGKTSQGSTTTHMGSTEPNVRGNMRYEEEDEDESDDDDMSENSEERRVEEARLKAAAAATARASVHAEIAKQETQQKQELENATEQHRKQLDEMKDKFHGEQMRERMRLEQEKETELNKLRARLNQEKSAEEAKQRREHNRLLEEMRKKLEEERDDEEARMAEQKQEKLRKMNVELQRNQEKDETTIHEEHKKHLADLRERLEKERDAEEKRMREENTLALEELETELQNERDSRRAEIAVGYEQEIDSIKKDLQEKQGKVKDDLERQHDEELAVLREMLTKEHSEAISGLRAQLEETTREERDRLNEQLEQVQTKGMEDEAAVRQQMSEEFEKKRETLEEEHRNQAAALTTTHKEEMDAMQRKFASIEREERTQLESALERVKKDGQNAIEDSRRQLEAERQALLSDKEQQEKESATLRASFEQQKQQLTEWKEQLHVEEEELVARRKRLEQEGKQLSAEEQAVSERQAQLSNERQRITEEKGKLQEGVETLRQEVSQLTSAKESLEAEIGHLNAAHGTLLGQQATLLQECMTAETVDRPRTSTPARRLDHCTAEVEAEDSGGSRDESQHDVSHSQEETMHVGELAAPEPQETLSSYEVAGVSTVLAEQTREKTRAEPRRQRLSEKRQPKQGKKSERRQDRQHKEPVKKQDEPIQELAARLAALTSRTLANGRQTSRHHADAVKFSRSETEGTVNSYLSSLSSLSTGTIIAGSLGGDVEETRFGHPRHRDVDVNGFTTESSGTDEDSDCSETSGLQPVNLRAFSEGQSRFPSTVKSQHQTRDIISSLHRVNNELSSVLARLQPAEAPSLPPPVRMAWTDRNRGKEKGYSQVKTVDSDEIDRRRQKYLGSSVEHSGRPSVDRGNTSRWTDGNLHKTLLMLEEQKRWLEQYRQTVSPQRVVPSSSMGSRLKPPEFMPDTGLQSTTPHLTRAGRASRYGPVQLELGESGEIRPALGVTGSFSKWNRRLY